MSGTELLTPLLPAVVQNEQIHKEQGHVYRRYSVSLFHLFLLHSSHCATKFQFNRFSDMSTDF